MSDAKTDAKNTWDDILEVVKTTPTMVFSVIGDSDSFVPRPWPKAVFQTALIEAAKSGGGMQQVHLNCHKRDAIIELLL